MAALGPRERLDFVLHHRLHDLQAGADAEGEQPLFELVGELTHRDADRVGQHQRCLLRGPACVVLRLLRRRATGGPCTAG